MASPTRQPSPHGQASRARIIRTGEEVLRDAGYHAFSTRRVAEACSISVGNLTYHFPSKQLLIEAVIEGVCDRYLAKHEEVVTDESLESGHRLEQLITWLVEDALTDETRALFRELWSMATHNAHAAESLKRLYATSVQSLTDEFALLNPGLSEEKRTTAAYLLLTMTEGMVGLFSGETGQDVDPRSLIPSIVRAVASALELS